MNEQEVKKMAQCVDTIVEMSREMSPEDFVAVIAVGIEGWELEAGSKDDHIRWLAMHLALRLSIGGWPVLFRFD